VYETFGTNEDGYVLKDADGNLYEGASMNFYRKRGEAVKFKATPTDEGVKFKGVYEPEQTS
jgi:hypothetical protein